MGWTTDRKAVSWDKHGTFPITVLGLGQCVHVLCMSRTKVETFKFHAICYAGQKRHPPCIDSGDDF